MTTLLETPREVMRKHSKSFWLAHKLLPPGGRDAGAVIYAWCRRADDLVDERPLLEAALALVRLEHELDRIYEGVPQADPLLAAFQAVVTRYGIPKQYPSELLSGLRMDVDGTVYGTLLDLCLYCYRVAGTVGLMMCHVMGVRHPEALRHAAHLGIAMQLTNICRDVAEDWMRGRLYVPLTFLDGRPPVDGIQGEFPAELREPMSGAVARLLTVADHFYASGDRGLPYLAPRCRCAVLAARLVYSSIGKVLLRRGCDVTQGRAYVPSAVKLWLAGRALARVFVSFRGWSSAQAVNPRQLPLQRYPADVLPV
ncbi:MAG TPA: phytoene/squalene synthase family protein [Polyangiaceae bacterium]|nr:phytoene/squalene synthase family protein [Polyangiaceae bacterium]